MTQAGQGVEENLVFVCPSSLRGCKVVTRKSGLWCFGALYYTHITSRSHLTIEDIRDTLCLSSAGLRCGYSRIGTHATLRLVICS